MALIGGKTPPPAAPPTAPAAPAAPVAAPAPAAKKTVAAKGKPGPKPGSERKPLELNLSGLAVTNVTTRQEMAKARRVRERSAEQKRLDAMVETAWTAWVEAGKPRAWHDMPGVRVAIPNAHYETLVSGIRKAGQYYDIKIRFGAPVTKDGMTECVFVAMDKPQNDDENDTDDDDNDNDSED